MLENNNEQIMNNNEENNEKEYYDLGVIRTERNNYFIKFTFSSMYKIEKFYGKPFDELIEENESKFNLIVVLLMFGLEGGMKREYDVDTVLEIADEIVEDKDVNYLSNCIMKTFSRDLKMDKAKKNNKNFVTKKK